MSAGARTELGRWRPGDHATFTQPATLARLIAEDDGEGTPEWKAWIASRRAKALRKARSKR